MFLGNNSVSARVVCREDQSVKVKIGRKEINQNHYRLALAVTDCLPMTTKRVTLRPAEL